MPGTVVDRGLEGVVVGETVLSNVEGEVGRLTYRGYDIDDLAPKATYEEVVALMLLGNLPTAVELAALEAKLASLRPLPEATLALLRALPRDAWPMDVLRTAVSSLSLPLPHKPSGVHTSDVDAALSLVAKTTTIVATWDRLRRGLEPIAPRPTLGTAANFLYMKNGQEPTAEHAKALDQYYVLLVDHGYNASTFSARVTASTNADLYCAITAAIATLTGELHGGAPSQVQDSLLDVGSPERAEQWVRDLLKRKGRLMGMGHREYKVRDPRAKHLEEAAKRLNNGGGSYAIARALEDAWNKVIHEEKPQARIYANVDFYTAPALGALGIPSDEYTCVFACSRMAGWSAHVLEQYANNRLIRPQVTYVGPAVHAYEPIGQRHAAVTTNGARG
jgi:citrate synthase